LLEESESYNNSTGTIFFNAPEICKEDQVDVDSKSKALDIWALGVTTYILAFLKLPFCGDNEMDIAGIMDSVINKQ
jgi:serine/threonine protein kinase